MIVLRGGPWDGMRLDDSGAEVIQMCVATKYDETGLRAAKGAKVGRAIYEPNEERTEAFWLENKWDGISLGSPAEDDFYDLGGVE